MGTLEMKGTCILALVWWTVLAAVGTLADENGPNEATENGNNVAQYALECARDQQLPEHVANCELLIDGVKLEFGLYKHELCCALLASRATKYMCCRQVRELCQSYSGVICPRGRRRIQQPRLAAVDASHGAKQSEQPVMPQPVVF